MHKSTQEKLALVNAIETMMQSGLSQKKACRALTVPDATFVRWRKALESGGAEALSNRKPTGRPRSFEPTQEELTTLRKLARQHDSAHWGIEQFAKHPDCQPATRAKIHEILDRAARAGRQPHWPLSLRRAAYVTNREKDEFRGPRHAQASDISPRKGMFYETAEGTVVPLLSHTAWMMHDYSTNQPYWITKEDGARDTCRQYLVACDVYSAAWLHAEAIGRERDAYRGEDILRFLLRTIDGQGTMPHFLLFERGRWESAAIHGLDLGNGHTWGGITELIHVIHGHTPRHKALLESKLNLLQRALAHGGRDIGRYAGEFEAATKSMLKVHKGTIDPERAGFLSQDESREAHWQAMQTLNERPMQRVNFDTDVVPKDLLQTAEARRPLPECERWRFFPVKMAGTVRDGGYVEKSLKGWAKSFRFKVNYVRPDVYLDNGFKILIAFDPAEPHLGAMVANAETGAKNRENWPLGHCLVKAELDQEIPQFSERKKAAPLARTSGASINADRGRSLTTQVEFGGLEGTTIFQRGVTPASDVAPAALRPGGGRRLAPSPSPGRLPGVRTPNRLELLARCAALEAD